MLPNFLVIGAMKAGTTSLYQYLSNHPNVHMSRPKETDFFIEDRDWKAERARYERYFDGAGPETVAIGEASTSYTRYPESEGTSARIAGVIPDVRLIYLVRHPIERMRSHYLHRLGAGRESEPIENALLANPIYVYTSCYARQIDRYLDHFASERTLIVRSESLRDDRLATMRRVYEFLGIDGSWKPSLEDREFYRTSDKRVPRPAVLAARRMSVVRRLAHHTPRSVIRLGRRVATQQIDPELGHISDDLRQRLEDRLRDDVRRLGTYMGEGFDGWGIS